MKVVGFTRVSTMKQQLGMKTQKRMIRDYCNTNGLELVEIITEEGISGDAKIRFGFDKLKDMVAKMKPGSVIVDMAVSQGGNCELSELDQIITKNNVKIVGEGNLPATIPINASELFAKNIQNFIQHLTNEGAFQWNLEDEITSGSLIIKDGEILQNSLKEVLNATSI